MEHGKQKQLAEAAGVSPQMLNNILSGRTRCPSSLAVKLEQVSDEVLGVEVPSTAWILAGLGYPAALNESLQ